MGTVILVDGTKRWLQISRFITSSHVMDVLRWNMNPEAVIP